MAVLCGRVPHSTPDRRIMWKSSAYTVVRFLSLAMESRMTKLAPLIFAIALLLLISGDAYACRCWKPSVETSFKGATTRIFSGEVVKLDFFRATLKVEGVWKGKPIEEIVMLT